MAAYLQALGKSKCVQSQGVNYVFHVPEKEEGNFRKEVGA